MAVWPTPYQQNGSYRPDNPLFDYRVNLTTENAVNTQIWIAIAMYVLVIVKKQLHPDLSFYTILQISSVTLLEKRPF